MATFSDIAARVKTLLSPHREDDPHLDSAIGLLMEDALTVLGEQTALGLPDAPQTFRRESQTSALDVAGVVDIAPLIDGTTARLMLKFEKDWLVLFSAVTDQGLAEPIPMVRCDDFFDFKRASQTDLFYLHRYLKGTVMSTKSFDRNVTPLAGTLLITGHYVPTLLEVIPDTEPLLAQIIVGLLIGKVPTNGR